LCGHTSISYISVGHCFDSTLTWKKSPGRDKCLSKFPNYRNFTFCILLCPGSSRWNFLKPFWVLKLRKVLRIGNGRSWSCAHIFAKKWPSPNLRKITFFRNLPRLAWTQVRSKHPGRYVESSLALWATISPKLFENKRKFAKLLKVTVEKLALWDMGEQKSAWNVRGTQGKPLEEQAATRIQPDSENLTRIRPQKYGFTNRSESMKYF
jgi:hypothetical protein